MSSRLNQVVRELRSLIMRGELKPGERVTETAIADKLGVSRTPVRLALSILEHENLVEGRANRGFRVREFTVEEYEKTLAVRATLDGMAARLAAENGLPPDIDETIDRVIDACETLVGKPRFESDDLQVFAKWNAIFHDSIAKASRNGSLERILEREMPLRFRAARMVFPFKPGLSRELVMRSHDDHITILDAIRSGEGARAEYLMREHIQMPHRRARRVVEEFGGMPTHDSVDIMVVAKPGNA